MGGSSLRRSLIVSNAVILICVAMLIGVTYSLFTDTKSVQHHIRAGDLEITLLRTELKKTTLDREGYLTDITVQTKDDVPVNFSKPSEKNVFEIGDGEKVIPGSKFVATLEISNRSDVVFGYWIEILCADKENGENLAKQLKVTLDTGVESSALVADGLIVNGENGEYIGELAVGDEASFTVTLEFLDDVYNHEIDNDLAQAENLKFDLIVHAVQLVKEK